jgi:hypothetical protein
MGHDDVRAGTRRVVHAGAAATIVVSEAGEGAHRDAAATAVAASDAHPDETSAGEQEPGGADALTIAALVAGLLGSVLGGAALVGQRRRA